MSGSDEESVRELADLYLAQTDEQMRELRAAIDALSAKEIERIAHKAAGASSTCGMSAIVPHLRALEQDARAEQLDNASALYHATIQDLARIRTFLQDYLKNLRETSGTA
jgi:HPt (histidine-containing phosphotransfer) domain-containing protein